MRAGVGDEEEHGPWGVGVTRDELDDQAERNRRLGIYVDEVRKRLNASCGCDVCRGAKRHREPRHPVEPGLALKTLIFAGALALVIAAALMLNCVEAGAADLKLTWCVPCFQSKSTCCDSLSDTLETSLKEQRVRMVRFRDNDTLDVGVVPEIGKECTRDSALFWVEPDSSRGTVGAVLLYSVDIAGNVSCHYSSYVFAFPMVGR